MNKKKKLIKTNFLLCLLIWKYIYIKKQTNKQTKNTIQCYMKFWIMFHYYGYLITVAHNIFVYKYYNELAKKQELMRDNTATEH